MGCDSVRRIDTLGGVGRSSRVRCRYRNCPKCRTRAYAPVAMSEVWTPTASFEGSDYVQKCCLACGFSSRKYVDTHRVGTTMSGDVDRSRQATKNS